MASLSKDEIIELLNDCLSKLEHSTAEYLLQTNPYVTDKDQDTMKAIQAVAAEEQALANELYRLMESLDGIPQPGLPDPMLAELNYLSFPYLLDKLIRDKEKTAKRHAPRVEAAEGHPEVKAFFEKVAATYAEHITKLKDLRTRKYGSTEPAPKKEEPAANGDGKAESAEQPAESANGEAAASEAAASS